MCVHVVSSYMSMGISKAFFPPFFSFLQLPANHNHVIQWRYKREKNLLQCYKNHSFARGKGLSLKKKHLWVLPGAISFCLFVCFPRSGRPVMAPSWLVEFSPGSRMLMSLCSSWGRDCCCSLLSLATAELFWDCLTTCLCWPTPIAMEPELG